MLQLFATYLTVLPSIRGTWNYLAFPEKVEKEGQHLSSLFHIKVTKKLTEIVIFLLSQPSKSDTSQKNCFIKKECHLFAYSTKQIWHQPKNRFIKKEVLKKSGQKRTGSDAIRKKDTLWNVQKWTLNYDIFYILRAIHNLFIIILSLC